MSQSNKETQKYLQSLLNSLPSRQTITYLQFLIIAKEMQLRFQSQHELNKLKNIFQSQVITKQRIKDILVFKRTEVQNNSKIQIVAINTYPKYKHQDEAYNHMTSILRKVGLLKTYLIDNYGDDQKKWFKTFDLSSKGLIRMFQLRWVLGSILNQMFTQVEIKLLYESLSTGDGITRQQFFGMFEGQNLLSKLQEHIKTPIKRRVNNEKVIKEYPFQLLQSAAQKHHGMRPMKINHNLRYYRKKKEQSKIKISQRIPVQKKMNKTFLSSFRTNNSSVKRRFSTNYSRDQHIFTNQQLKYRSRRIGTSTKTQMSEKALTNSFVEHQHQKVDRQLSFIQKNSKWKRRPMSSNFRGY